MGMAMDTAMAQKVIRSSVYLLGIIASFNILSAELEVTPSVEGDVIYTDNVDLVSEDLTNSEITTISGSLDVQAQGNDGNLSLNYELKKLFYSYDSEKDELYNTLDFSVDKTLSRTGFRVDGGASISNIAQSVVEYARDDLVAGNTIESRNVEAGISFQSNPNGAADFYTRTSGSITNNEDSTGDYSSYQTEMSFGNGNSINDYFWSSDYTYRANVGRESSETSEFQELSLELGVQPVHGYSPFIRGYFEDYSGEDADQNADSSSFGPGLRFYWQKESYIEVSYDFDVGGENEDYWRGALFLNPTSRTSLEFDYKKRFYGDAYDFSLSHRNRRLTNTISYNEEITNYDRTYYLEGDDIGELRLSRTFSWLSSLQLRRTTASLELSAEKQEAVNETSTSSDIQSYGSDVSIEYKLSRQTTFLASFEFDYYQFEEQELEEQEDYYRIWEIGLERSFAEDLFVQFNLVHQNKSSSTSGSEYKENRVSINLRKQL